MNKQIKEIGGVFFGVVFFCTAAGITSYILNIDFYKTLSFWNLSMIVSLKNKKYL